MRVTLPSVFVRDREHRFYGTVCLGCAAALMAANFAIANSEMSTAKALHLCAVFDNTGDLSEKCEISGTSVKISLDTSTREARKICAGVANTISLSGGTFDRGWRLTIYSPTSGRRAIASCDLK